MEMVWSERVRRGRDSRHLHQKYQLISNATPISRHFRPRRRGGYFVKKEEVKLYKKNNEIKAEDVFVIDEDGTQLGEMTLIDAIAYAQKNELDLVEVAPNATPPVCKIIDFGKLQYQKEKQDRKNRAQAKKTGGETKGIRLSVKIGDHDMMVRIKAGQKFLDKGDKLKMELQLRGREKAHPELAKEVIERYISLLEREVVIEAPVNKMGNRFSSIVSLKKK